MSDRAKEIAEAKRLALKAAELGKDDAVALTFGGLALGMATSDVETGLAHIDRALVLSPNFATAWTASGILRTNLGDTETAIEHLSRAMRLSPLDPLMFMMHAFLAFAHFLAGRHDAAWPLAEKACREQPNYSTGIRVAAACNAAAGRRAEARKHVEHALRLDPELRISRLHDRVSTFSPNVLARYVDACGKRGCR